LRDLAGELVDRFGPLPDPVENLLLIQEARLLAGEFGAETVVLRGGRFTVGPVELRSAEVRELQRAVAGALYSLSSREVSVRLKPPSGRQQAGMREGLEVLDAILAARRAVAA